LSNAKEEREKKGKGDNLPVYDALSGVHETAQLGPALLIGL